MLPPCVDAGPVAELGLSFEGFSPAARLGETGFVGWTGASVMTMLEAVRAAVAGVDIILLDSEYQSLPGVGATTENFSVKTSAGGI